MGTGRDEMRNDQAFRHSEGALQIVSAITNWKNRN